MPAGSIRRLLTVASEGVEGCLRYVRGPDAAVPMRSNAAADNVTAFGRILEMLIRLCASCISSHSLRLLRASISSHSRAETDANETPGHDTTAPDGLQPTSHHRYGPPGFGDEEVMLHNSSQRHRPSRTPCSPPQAPSPKTGRGASMNRLRRSSIARRDAQRV